MIFIITKLIFGHWAVCFITCVCIDRLFMGIILWVWAMIFVSLLQGCCRLFIPRKWILLLKLCLIRIRRVGLKLLFYWRGILLILSYSFILILMLLNIRLVWRNQQILFRFRIIVSGKIFSRLLMIKIITIF
jgi:hypothetical protein